MAGFEGLKKIRLGGKLYGVLEREPKPGDVIDREYSEGWRQEVEKVRHIGSDFDPRNGTEYNLFCVFYKEFDTVDGSSVEMWAQVAVEIAEG